MLIFCFFEHVRDLLGYLILRCKSIKYFLVKIVKLFNRPVAYIMDWLKTILVLNLLTNFGQLYKHGQLRMLYLSLLLEHLLSSLIKLLLEHRHLVKEQVLKLTGSCVLYLFNQLHILLLLKLVFVLLQVVVDRNTYLCSDKLLN